MCTVHLLSEVWWKTMDSAVSYQSKPCKISIANSAAYQSYLLALFFSSCLSPCRSWSADLLTAVLMCMWWVSVYIVIFTGALKKHRATVNNGIRQLTAVYQVLSQGHVAMMTMCDDDDDGVVTVCVMYVLLMWLSLEDWRCRGHQEDFSRLILVGPYSVFFVEILYCVLRFTYCVLLKSEILLRY